VGTTISGGLVFSILERRISDHLVQEKEEGVKA